VLTISQLYRSFGGQRVFEDASWFVGDGDRVALVGANGSGKSTLLRMIAGMEEPDSGNIVLPKGTTVGYLPQDGLSSRGRTVLHEALDAFTELRQLEKECRRLERELERCDPQSREYAGILDAYGEARGRWDAEGSYDYESRAETVLSGLGFCGDDFQRDTGEFSGGWQMRIALAKLLLRQPGLLLLDEPTNHLDLEARNWLEDFLCSYPSTVILVAHDRYFLDVTAKRITEVCGGKLHDYPAPYSRYEERREQELEQQRAAYEAQQEEIARLEAFISRFRYQASKAALVQSRIKFLEKLERLPPPDGASRAVRFRFPPCARSGRQVLRLEGAAKSYGDLRVYENLDLTIERGRKVALVGPNGAGKSTLIRMLAGTEPLSRGERTLGYNVDLGYFAQDQAQALSSRRSVLDEATAAAPIEMVPQVRQLLGAFLFSGDSVDKPVAVLSGGERHRLALAILLLHPSNCLLLDEPTNHLDMAAKEVLLRALQEYDGTVVIVAHDRYLLDELPDEIIEVGSGHATRYLGNYEDYLRSKAREAASGSVSQPVHDARLAEDATADSPEEKAAPPRDRAEEKKQARNTVKRQRDLEKLEQEIAGKESALADLASLINQPDFHSSHERPQQVYSDYARVKREIDNLYSKLERLDAARE
jgi:ATP-binding cassette subfamily F protein 3